MNPIEILNKEFNQSINQYEILYDSDLQGYDKQLLTETIFNKSQLLFLIESTQNDVFGFHFHQPITKTNRYIYDKELYFFQLYQKGICTPIQFHQNEMNPLTGIIISDDSSDLFSCGMNDFESDINYFCLHSPYQHNLSVQFNQNNENNQNSFLSQFQFRKRNHSMKESKFHLFDDFFELSNSSFDSEFHFILQRLLIISID